MTGSSVPDPGTGDSGERDRRSAAVRSAVDELVLADHGVTS